MEITQAIDVSTLISTPEKVEEKAVPVLPFDLPNIEPVGLWLDHYVQHAMSISSMTPEIFHESAGLWLLSMAIARRVALPMPFGLVYPNLYILWLAPTTLWHKTTGMNVAVRMAQTTLPHLIAPQDMTPESFLSDLAGNEPTNIGTMTEKDRELWKRERDFCAQRGIMLDELSGLMASSNRDYNAGLIEAFLRFYDCDELYRRSTRSQGRIVVRKSYITMIGASTPAAMSLHLANDRLWSMGWWPRFALLAPGNERPLWSENTTKIDPPVGPLLNLYNRLPQAKYPDFPDAKQARMTVEAEELWKQYSKTLSYDLLTPDIDEKLWGSYGRLPIHALKIAILFASLEWKKEIIIGLPELVRAIRITERWRTSAHIALSMTDETDYSKLQRRLLRSISRGAEKGGLTFRDICRNISNLPPKLIEDILQQLVTSERIVEKVCKPPAQGRPVTRYVLNPKFWES